MDNLDEYSWYIPIVGHPSAGKSTLIKVLTGRHVVVGKRSGTTKKITAIKISPHVAVLDFPGFGIIKRRSKNESLSDTTQQIIVDFLEDHSRKILFGILVSDLSTVSIVSEKFDEKGIIPIDYELAEFIAELSGRNTIVVGNKIDKLDSDLENIDEFAEWFPDAIDFFPISLKEKTNIEPLLVHLQVLSDEKVGPELKNYFWKLSQ